MLVAILLCDYFFVNYPSAITPNGYLQWMQSRFSHGFRTLTALFPVPFEVVRYHKQSVFHRLWKCCPRTATFLGRTAMKLPQKHNRPCIVPSETVTPTCRIWKKHMSIQMAKESLPSKTSVQSLYVDTERLPRVWLIV